MRLRPSHYRLPLLTLSILMAQPAFTGAAGQTKNPLVWERPAVITRVAKPNRKRAGRLPRTERVPPLTLQWHLLMRDDGNVQRPVDSGTVFKTRDQLKLSITTNQDGFLYVINQPEGQSGVVLFPDLRINGGRNFVKKNTDYAIPSYCPGFADPNDCWWEMSPPAGAETLIVIFSRDEITSLPSEVTRPNATVDAGVIEGIKAKSRQSVRQQAGAPALPNKKQVPFAVRVQNANLKDNEELITTITLKHSE